jgi:hypothetical protein
MMLSRRLFTIVVLLSFCCEGHSLAQDRKPNSISAQQLVTLKDRILVGVDGTTFYQTAYDGGLRRLTPVTKDQLLKLPPLGKIVPMTLPARVMLDELGLETPVKDQYGRGTCTLFSSVGAIESEYLAQYGMSLDLSEEYLHNMIDETRPIDWDGGVPTEKLYNASYYGLPPEQTWPYIPDISTLLNLEGTIVPLLPTSDYGELFSTNIVMVDRDLVNYSPLTYPPAAAHAQAIYGPAPNALASVQNTGDPTPFETLIAQHHSVVFMTATGAWSQNSQTGIFEYNPNGDQTTNHAILLVGYDHDKQIFRIKNSWGAQWNGNGYADFTYELFLKTATGAVYITGLRNPAQSSGGNAVWRGFWRGSLNGVNGVAVIYHTYQPDGSGNTSVVDDAAAFFGDDGSSVPLPDVAAATLNAVTLSGTNVRVSLQQGAGNTSTASQLPSGATTTWYRCAAVPGQYNVNPATDPATVQDPYVFPPCSGATLPCCTSGNATNCIPIDRVNMPATGSCPPGFAVIGQGFPVCNAAVSPAPYCTTPCSTRVVCGKEPTCSPGKPCQIQ